MGDRRGPAGGHSKKLPLAILNGELIAGLEDDDPVKRAAAPVLDLLHRIQITAVLNRAMRSSIGPFDWDDWPEELIEASIAWALHIGGKHGSD